MERRGRPKKNRPIGPDWYDNERGTFYVGDAERIVDRATTPKNTFNSMKRALLDLENYYDLTGGASAKAIIFKKDLILVV